METVDVVVIKSRDLLSRDVLHGWDEVNHLWESAANDIESIVLVAGVVLRGRKVHEIHRDNRPRALGDRERFGESISSRGSTFGDPVTVMTSPKAVDNVGSEGLPIKMTVDRGERFLVTEMSKSFVYMIDEHVPNSFGTTAVGVNLDIRNT
jgi:hypothetical protein